MTAFRCGALLVGLLGFLASAPLPAEPAENPLAVQLVNTSIEIFRQARRCGWDRSLGDVPTQQVVRLSSKMLRGAVEKGQLTLAEAAHAQANMVIPGYVNDFVGAHAKDPVSCRSWQALWSDWSDPAAAAAPERQPLVEDLTAEEQSTYWRMNNTSCTLFELRRLDDGRREPRAIARAALDTCHPSVTAYLKTLNLSADDPATLEQLLDGAVQRVIRNRQGAGSPR